MERFVTLLGVAIAISSAATAQDVPFDGIPLPSSKVISNEVPGNPQKLSSLPVSAAVSPDGRYLVTVNAGFGTVQSGYMQSIAVLDLQTSKLLDFPDQRTKTTEHQGFFSGLAFSADGGHLYANFVSLTDPEGKAPGDTGAAVAVYSFNKGRILPERLLPVPPQVLGVNRHTSLREAGGRGVPYPAAIARVPGSRPERILIADELSDDVLLMNIETGAIEKRFDVSESESVPGTYPNAVVVSPEGRHAFVALSNASSVVELDLGRGVVEREIKLLRPQDPVAPGSHPSALEMSSDGSTIYVALANRDCVAKLDISSGHFDLEGYIDARLPGQSYFGAGPEGLALTPDGNRLYVADMGSNAVAVVDTRQLTRRSARRGMIEPVGFIPTEWMPMSVRVAGRRLYIATGKGRGSGPNNFPQQKVERGSAFRPRAAFTYLPTLLYGSLATVETASVDSHRKELTEAVLAANRMKAAKQSINFHGVSGRQPIRHVIYIIKENRTYDQVLGDLRWKGEPVGNGDAGLTMYGEEITPNQHALALQFGVLDNFMDSGEVSGQGHVWSTAAIGSDYLERAWPTDYRNKQHSYDFEGRVAEGYPLLQHIPDVVDPGTGYLWGNLTAHAKTLYHFGEYVSSVFCNDKDEFGIELPPTEGAANPDKQKCARKEVRLGERFPEQWGGDVSKYPWPIPLLAKNIATKPELVGHFAEEAPDFNLRVPDQIRVEVFIRHLNRWVADLAGGHDSMPDFILLRLPNDHTSGTTPGGPTPRSSIADNDLAVGRAVEAVSHSPYWNNTALFILEDDAQSGADHVDAHRSTALVISKYSPRSTDGAPFVDSHYYTTVSVLRTMETLLGLPPMNNNDAFAPLLAPLFSGPGDQPVFTADRRNERNGLIYQANGPRAVGAKASAKMDFSHADRADTQKLNVILWKDAMGGKPVPSMLLQKQKKERKHDDDD